MAWYAYCIAERQAFPELCRHRRPMPLTGVSGLFGNQTFLFPASDLAVIVSEHSPEDSARILEAGQQPAKDHARVNPTGYRESSGWQPCPRHAEIRCTDRRAAQPVAERQRPGEPRSWSRGGLGRPTGEERETSKKAKER